MSKASSTQIILLTGNDSYLIQESVRKLIAKHVDPDWHDFNLNKLEGDIAEVSTIIDAWLTPPFYGDCRLVLVQFFRNSERLAQLFQQLVLVHEKKTFETQNVLLIVADSVDKRKKETKAFLSFASHQDFLQTKSWNIEKELFPWVEEEVRKVRKRIARPALERLILAVGVDKNALKMALDKLLLYIDERPIIEEHDVGLLVQHTEADIFVLLEQLARRNYAEALQQLHNLMLKEPVQKIIATLATSLRNLFRMKTLLAHRWATNDIATELGLNPYVLKKNMALWEKYSLKEMERLIRRLLEIDTLTKSSSLTGLLGLELWIKESMTK